jgi:threonine dehydrogenase-like Zn-dependent dehydrogenase
MLSILLGVKKMKIAKAYGPKDIRIIDVEAPVPGTGEVLIAVKASGICGSDKWFWKVQGLTEYIAGHEVAGEIIALGNKVSDLKIGDRVSVNNVKGCGHCPECKAGNFVRCAAHIEHMGHGFSEFVVVPEVNCLLLDDKVSYEEGSLIFDNWGTPYCAIERAGDLKGKYVAVSGCGPIGLGTIVLSKLFGAHVIAVDPVEERRKKALDLGADTAVSSEGAASNIKELTESQGIGVWFECSGKAQAYETAFEVIKVGGTIVSIGEGAKFEMRPSEMLINKHLNLLGTLYSTMEHGKKVQELMVKGFIDPLCFTTHRFSLEELPKVFGDVVECKNGILKSIVIM